MRGDKAALGTMPTAAFQYCEPMRTASSFGWYIFPPTDIILRWNGADVEYRDGDDWTELKSIGLSDAFAEDWDSRAPDDLQGCWPPFMTALFVSGVVQIWSGLLIRTRPDWSVLIGPPPNLVQSRHYSCFEGLVETDRFRPCPLFVNIRLQATDREIVIPRSKPLFFVRPVRRESYEDESLQFAFRDGVGELSADDWSGYRNTVRKSDAPPEEYKPGRYGAARRRRAKREPE
jgi:Family of unknown function (DUF6065)